MNLKFNDKSDIYYHDRILAHLKEKNEIATNFFSIVRLYNYLTGHKADILSFTASQKNKNFGVVNRNFGAASGSFEKLNLQSDEFVHSLAKYGESPRP